MTFTDSSVLDLPAAAQRPACYRITLFEGLCVRASGAADVTRFRTRKTGLLLAYLALFPRRHGREELIERFWPDLPPEAGRDNLSGCLSSLRRHFGGENADGGGTGTVAIVLADRYRFWLNKDLAQVDVAAFEHLLETAGAPSTPISSRRAMLESAVALYQGPLLSDV